MLTSRRLLVIIIIGYIDELCRIGVTQMKPSLLSKSLCVLVAVVLSLTAFPVFADDGLSLAYEPEGEPIETADAFLCEMSTDGDYYLEADITLDESYESGCFYGTLDGNGHTVTLNGCPMFTEFAGTLKNINIEGKVSLPKQDAVGAVCMSVSDDATFDNIIVRADVTGKSGNAGGLVGQIDSDQCTVTFTNCVNEGTVTGKQHVGGLVGYSKSLQLSFSDCENHGEITSNGGNAGGLIGYFGLESGSYSKKKTVSAINCINTGKIFGESSAGGVIGRVESSNAVLDKCTNSGEISSSGTAAGIIASAGRSDGKVCLTVSDCNNVGDAGDGTTQYAAGIIGKATCVSSPSSSIKSCSNFGAISAATVGAQIVTVTDGKISIGGSLAACGFGRCAGMPCIICNVGDPTHCNVTDMILYGFKDADMFELQDPETSAGILIRDASAKVSVVPESAALERLQRSEASVPYLHDGGMALGVSAAADSLKTKVSVRVWIQKGLYDIIKSEVEAVGILIADEKTVNSLGGLTLETFEKYGGDKDGTFFCDEFQSADLSEENGKYEMLAVIDGERFSDATICAVGYIRLDDGTVTYGNVDRMSVAELATRALEDVADTSDVVYCYETNDGLYSPYSPEFREKLGEIANG